MKTLAHNSKVPGRESLTHPSTCGCLVCCNKRSGLSAISPMGAQCETGAVKNGAGTADPKPARLQQRESAALRTYSVESRQLYDSLYLFAEPTGEIEVQTSGTDLIAAACGILAYGIVGAFWVGAIVLIGKFLFSK